ncbi:prenyltransferase/squalene oxidase repeat-containing protein [Tepidimicrobium xylanilyticum]
MNFKNRKLFLLILIIILSLHLFACSSSNKAGVDLDKQIEETANLMVKMVTDPTVSSLGGEWTVFSLARSDLDIDKAYFEKYYQNLVQALKEKDGILHDRKYTEYSRVILALTAIGKDPTDVEGYNLLEALGDYEKVIYQGINGPAFALIALDSKNYEIPYNPNANIQGTRDMYIEYILEHQLRDGGFSLLGEEPSDPDVTAMVLQALSKYKEKPEVEEAIGKALDYLSSIQLEDGGYSSWGSANSESVVQVIVALTELAIDPDDERFVKGGNSLMDNLLTFYLDGGGFMHIKEGTKENGGGQAGTLDLMATDQGLYGLIAYKRYKDGKNSLYDMTDVK